MKLKKYNQYIREDLTQMSPGDDNEIEGERKVGPVQLMDNEFNDGDDASGVLGNNMNGVGEEEEYEYEGTKLMKELADKLGAKVENNSINFDGKKIEYFSETGAFAIDKKGKYKTIDEVFNKLTK